MINIKEYDPNKLEKDLEDKIIEFYMYFVNLGRKEIQKHLKNKELIYVFFQKGTKNVVGVAAIKWLAHKDSIIIYVGNVLFREKYQRQNFMSHLLFRTYWKTLIKFPGKNIYFSVFMTTPKAYNLCKRFPQHYPRPDTTTPDEFLDIMDTVSQNIAGKNNYTSDGHVFITDNFQKRNFRYEVSEKIILSYNGFFEKVNPDFAMGKQLVVVFPVTTRGFLTAFKSTVIYYCRKIF